MTITDHIQYLLTRHDCVVVAGLGAFVVQRVPASLSADGRMLMPPYRMVVFNNNISHDDGMLAGSIARREGISYEQARQMVADEVGLMRTRIAAESKLELDRVGVLRLSSGNALEFTPAAERPIVMMPLSGLAPVSVDVVEAEQPNILEVDLNKRGRVLHVAKRAMKYAASVALLAGMGFLLTTPTLLDDSRMDKASISLPKISKPSKIEVVEQPAVEEPRTLLVGIPSDYKGGGEVKPVVVRTADIDVANPTDSYSCFVIVASCGSQREAQRFIAEHKHIGDLDVIKSDGRYRVYAAVSNNYDAAFDYKTNNPEITKHYPNAWVYQK